MTIDVWLHFTASCSIHCLSKMWYGNNWHCLLMFIAVRGHTRLLAWIAAVKHSGGLWYKQYSDLYLLLRASVTDQQWCLISQHVFILLQALMPWWLFRKCWCVMLPKEVFSCHETFKKTSDFGAQIALLSCFCCSNYGFVCPRRFQPEQCDRKHLEAEVKESKLLYLNSRVCLLHWWALYGNSHTLVKFCVPLMGFIST